ncbi:MAG: molybdopterin-dependent oxidoreductase [Anaerolineae bacterium]
MKTTINGKEFEFDPHPTETAIDVIREQAGLTGTKMACGGGICGACTVLVDDVPMCSCLMPANHMERKDIQTIEAHGRDNLHPVQRAFMANEGLQCGFCTPGFVNEGIAFYNRWQAKHGNTRPSHHEIALAMGGHLCRCAAYVGIYAAIGDACEGKFDEVTEIVAPRMDALEKVTGEAKYTADTKWPDQLEGKIIRSAHPNGIVRKVDSSEALALEGVIAVADLLEGKNRVRWVGQPIAAVAAINGRIAEQALKLIKVDYEVLPAVIDFEEAMDARSAEVWEDGYDDQPTAAEGTSLPYRWTNNVGQVRAGILTARRSGAANRRITNNPGKNVVSNDFYNHQQVHTALEPHGAVAKWDGPQKLRVMASSQGIRALRTEIAEHFDLDVEQVTTESHYIGGGFGGKQGLYNEIVAAITLARYTDGKPVRIIDSRLEDLSYSSLRPGSLTKTTLVTKDNGAPDAMKIHAYGNAGTAGGTMPATFAWLTGPSGTYYDNKDFAVMTHTANGTPFRGPDMPATAWAVEQSIDDAAERHGLDPVTIRRRWYPDHEIKGRLLDWVETIPAWKELQANPDKTGRFRRGIGLSTTQWMFIYNPNTEVRVSSSPEGIKVSCSTQDIGNGTRTSLAKPIEDLMGIDRHDVIIDIGYADRPNGPTAGGSQVTTSVYPTTYKAAEDVVAHLIKEAQSKLGLNSAKLGKGGVNHSSGFTPWKEILAVAEPFSATDKRGAERGPLGLRLNLAGGESAPAPGMRKSHSAIVTEVEVDTRLGKIKPLNVWTGIAVGKIFVKELANSQMYSGVIQGLGYALYEQKQYDRKSGHTLSANLNDYRIPGIGDTPNIHIHFDEKGYEEVRGQGIGLSELATVGVAGSVGNAVYHATGWRPLSTPITPHDVVTGLKKFKG